MSAGRNGNGNGNGHGLAPIQTVRVTRLDNGIRVATDAMPGVASVSLGAWVGVGTRDEAPEVNGVAHMLEHMAFKGTRRRSARAIAEEIETVGGHLNAFTSREETAYYAKVLAEDAPLAVDVIADILQESTFDPDELSRERQVILQEIGQTEDTPDDIVFDHLQEVAFPEQPMGRPVLGTIATVAAITRQQVMDYMAGSYAGERMVVTAAGAVEHDRFVEVVAKAFAGVPATRPLQRRPAVYQGGSRIIDRDLEQVHVVLGFPGLAHDDDAWYAQQLLATLLGGGMSSRLFQEIRENRGLVYAIYAFASSFADTGLMTIYAGTGEDEVSELIPAICEEIVKAANAITGEELERARAQARAGILMSLESTGHRCEQLGHHLLAFGRPIPVAESLDQLAAVDVDTVRAVLRQMIAARPTVAALGPTRGVETAEKVANRLRLDS